MQQIELAAANEMEAREKLWSVSNGLKVLWDGHVGRVPRVKNLTCKLNFANVNLEVWPPLQNMRTLVLSGNFPPYGTYVPCIASFEPDYAHLINFTYCIEPEMFVIIIFMYFGLCSRK